MIPLVIMLNTLCIYLNQVLIRITQGYSVLKHSIYIVGNVEGCGDGVVGAIGIEG